MKREYEILSTLDHKNIIKAKEFFYDEASGSAQLVLEYFQSKNLEELIKEGIKGGHRLEGTYQCQNCSDILCRGKS